MPLLLSFMTSAALLPFFICLSVPLGALDLPGEGRRVHTQPTPRIGGLGIFFSLLLLSPCFSFPAAPVLFAGGALTVALGLTDDVFSLPPGLKLLGQSAAALLPLCFGLAPTRWLSPAGPLPLSPWVGGLFSVLLSLLLMNAANLSDGLDALAAGCLLPGFLFCGAEGGLLLAGSILGFLLFNLPPAKAFLGDGGSLFLGYALSVLLLSRSRPLSPAILLFALLPILDLLFALLRRGLTGRPLFTADRGHFHHRLLDQGLPPLAISLLFFLFSLGFSLLGSLLF